MRSRHLILLVIAVLAGFGSLAASHWRLSESWLESLSSNLAAGFLGSFLTVLLIDRAIAKERDSETRRVRALALGQLRPTTLQHLDLLCAWFKAAAKLKPTTEASDFRGIFSEEYYREICFLDFSKAAPTSPPVTWFRWSATVISELRMGLSAVLDKYAVFLDAETLEILQELASSPVLRLLESMASWPTGDAARAKNRTYNVLAGLGVIDHLRRHIELLLRLIAKFNESVPRPIQMSDLPLWREDVGGPFGTARMTDEEMRASNPMVAMARGLPPVGGPKDLRPQE